ncbi:MAG: DnaB-like helicase C-terminal domain-containing protein [Candidatus Tyrphobacter sp.]
MSDCSRAKVYTLSDLLEELVDEHSQADQALAEGRNLGPVIQFPILRDELGGNWPIGMVGMHATPGAGKSAFGIQAMMQADCPAIYLTCEMSAKTVLRRMIANATGEYLGKLGRGKTNASNIRDLAKAVVSDHPYIGIIDAVTAPCPEDLLKNTVTAMRKHGDHVFLVVDSLHAWARSMNPQLDEYQAVSNAVDIIRSSSAKLNVGALTILERNRASMESGGLSAGASSRKIEYSAEAIIELQYVAEGADGISLINLKMNKNRNGRAGVKIGYAFDGAMQRFEELEKSVVSEEKQKSEKPVLVAVPSAPEEPQGYEDKDLFG